jgi:putative heme iron utilization protein
VAHEGRYCVYLSDLARHTANLRATARASVLFILFPAVEAIETC